jgi:hypothetical protein
MDFPHLIDLGVFVLLVLILLLALKTARDMRTRGEVPPGKFPKKSRQ